MSSISMEGVALILRPYRGEVGIWHDIAFVASNTQGYLKQNEIWGYHHGHGCQVKPPVLPVHQGQFQAGVVGSIFYFRLEAAMLMFSIYASVKIWHMPHNIRLSSSIL